ncbi:MAG: Gfo/Idh/MocA family oxidoreductase [Brevefilum sp.]|nr:Gfo/Idh/MocA family oxidoreductase [Brevefilum sp.]MDW7755009.1 Gfo/Idh/MocA family oxidoreductase [Brevefilum sp.]
MDKFRWGILSTANIGRKAMIPALKKIPIAEVLAVASRDGERAKKFAEELEIPKPYGSYQALLEDPEIDAVYIPLPNHLHKEWTIRAAEAGKYILCEKPLALIASECEMMIAAANENGVILMESFMYRYHPRILAAVEMVRSGKIGSLKTIETGFTFYMHNRDDIRMKPEMGGGALMDVGCYCINISRLMAGRKPVAVQAQAVWASAGVDEQLVGVLDFGDGLYAHFDCAFNQSSRQHCILAGTEGYLSIPEVFNPGEKRSVIQEVREGTTVQVHDFEGVDEYVLIAEQFMHTIQGEETIYPIEDSIINMQVIEALLESARNDGLLINL